MIHAINGISSSKIINTNIDPEIHKTDDAIKLKESCQQFESILWSKLWKDMKKTAMSISGADKERPYKQMEDLSLEMATDDLIESSGGAGLWKMLYDSMIGKVAADKEAQERREADEEAAKLFDVRA
ncbi:MAG: hypothetical protein SPL10_03470 [Synergistales bacterium]|nr:hypothetical protein [Synergistales bacterium]MDY6402216.1 hypothetical protein [Synergistales bacterium]MDY6404164.1 hypothetical protein [Synergistales bacterium]MDY6409784.1 hypothetical protein [Synergistales bacterium]MDY6414201.1 hypothetical protein [Synergistales bacterium]